MTVPGIGSLLRYQPKASRLACLPAVVVLALFLAVAAPDGRMVIECTALLGVRLLQMIRPTLLGWAIALTWFTLSTLDTIRVGLRPDFGLAALPIALVLVPDVFLLVLRPRAEAHERGASALALVAALAGRGTTVRCLRPLMFDLCLAMRLVRQVRRSSCSRYRMS